MLPYFIIFIFLSLFAILDAVNVDSKQKQWFLLLVAVVLILFAGLRGENFADYSSYREYFRTITNGESSSVVAMDPGFLLINKFVASITDNPLWLFLLISLLAIGINFRCYVDYTPFYFIAILVYFSHTFLGRELMQIRAGLAAAIILYSYKYIVSRKFWKFLFVVLTASTIHLASIVVLIIYPISRLKIKIKLWYTILGISLIVGYLTPLGKIIKILPQIDILQRIQYYSDNSMYNINLGILTNPTLLKQLIICLVGLMFYDILKVKVWGYHVLLTSYVVATCWLILFRDFSIFSARIATFFSITEVLLLSGYVYLFGYRSRIFYLFLVIIFAFAMLFLNIFQNKIVHYHTIF